MRLKADITLFLISIIWGSAFVAQRVAGQVGSVYIFNGVRYLLAGLVVLPFAWRALRPNGSQVERPTSISREQTKWMLIAGFFLCMGSALQQAGMQYTTAGNAGFITSLYVVLIPLILFFFWGEMLFPIGRFVLCRNGRQQWFGRGRRKIFRVKMVIAQKQRYSEPAAAAFAGAFRLYDAAVQIYDAFGEGQPDAGTRTLFQGSVGFAAIKQVEYAGQFCFSNALAVVFHNNPHLLIDHVQFHGNMSAGFREFKSIGQEVVKHFF